MLIGDRTCLGKGVFVVVGNDVTIRGVTLRGARSDDANGAGIRGEGTNLTVDCVRFLDNENGICRSAYRAAHYSCVTAVYRQRSRARACAHGIYAGALERHGRAPPASSATRDGPSREVPRFAHGGDRLDHRGRARTASYLISQRRRGSDPRQSVVGRTAIAIAAQRFSIGAEGVDRPTPEICAEANAFTLEETIARLFVTNHTATSARLERKWPVAPCETLQWGDGSVD